MSWCGMTERTSSLIYVVLCVSTGSLGMWGTQIGTDFRANILALVDADLFLGSEWAKKSSGYSGNLYHVSIKLSTTKVILSALTLKRTNKDRCTHYSVPASSDLIKWKD